MATYAGSGGDVGLSTRSASENGQNNRNESVRQHRESGNGQECVLGERASGFYGGGAKGKGFALVGVEHFNPLHASKIRALGENGKIEEKN